MGSILSRILGAPRFIPAIDVETLASQAQSKHSACSAHLGSRATLPPALKYMSSLPPPASPSNRFVLFTKLPAELNLMIWELALPGERIVRIQEFTESSTHNTIRRAYQCIGSKARVPTLLHICHESRTLALKHYTMTLENRLLKPAYFNPDVDVLLFASFSDLFKFLGPTKMKQMRSQTREARLYSGQRLGSIRRYMSRLHR